MLIINRKTDKSQDTVKPNKKANASKIEKATKAPQSIEAKSHLSAGDQEIKIGRTRKRPE
jgi:hypothetical protein